MALYVPQSARRRRLVLTIAIGLVVGVLLGFLIGRATSENLDDAVASVESQAEDSATALERIPIEYEQAVAGEGGESTATIAGAVDRARGQLDQAYEAAIWFGADARSATDAAFDRLDQAVADQVPQAELEAEIDDAVQEIEVTFDLDR
jgi:hypothetical protein